MMYSPTFLFANPIINLNFENDEFFLNLEKYIINLSSEPGVIKSNVNGWQSDSLIHLNDNFLFLDDINDMIGVCLSSLNVNKDMTLSTMWANVNYPGSYNLKHVHPVSSLSGVLYVKFPTNSGNLVFNCGNEYEKFNFCESVDESFLNDNNAGTTYEVLPKVGTMVIFPSYLSHHVEVNKSNELRISISFNLSQVI